jgi:hypothetical protein
MVMPCGKRVLPDGAEAVDPGADAGAAACVEVPPAEPEPPAPPQAARNGTSNAIAMVADKRIFLVG